MRRRYTPRIRNQVKLKTALRRRLLAGIAGLLIAVTGITIIYDNFSAENSSAGNLMRATKKQPAKLQEAGNGAATLHGIYAAEVISYFPTKCNDGSSIPAASRQAALALGAPQNNERNNFVSLGFGGEITLKFAAPVANGTGDDIQVTESTAARTPCTRYPERVQAFASQDGCNFIYLGEGCQDARFDLGDMSWALYIRLKDCSPLTHPYGNQVADGYDVDGVQGLNGAATAVAGDGLVAGSPQKVVKYIQGSRRNGTAIHPSRTNPEMALGVPQNNDLGINFVSLGFTGMIVLKFDYVVFNNEGNDLQVIETSNGIPECSMYPEQAFFEGSLDGAKWFPLGEVCLDGELDLGAGVYAIQYIRVTDRSPATAFPNSADGYDLDGIVVLEACAGDKRIRPFDNNSVPDEIGEVKISPNPFHNNCELEYETGSANELVVLTFYNYVGQQVYRENIQVPGNTLYRHQINGSKLPKGVYIVVLESGGQKQSLRVIKN